MEEYWEEDDRRKQRQEEIRHSTYREYWGRRKFWAIVDGVVAALAGSQVAAHRGAAAGLLGAILAFIVLEAMWAAIFYVGRAFLRRARR